MKKWYGNEQRFERLLSDLHQNGRIINEIVLFANDFTEDGFLPQKWQEHETILLKQRIQQLKAAGFPSVGLNVISTLGQTNDGAFVHPTDGMDFSTDIRGNEARGRLCPPNPIVSRQYLSQSKRNGSVNVLKTKNSLIHCIFLNILAEVSTFSR